MTMYQVYTRERHKSKEKPHKNDGSSGMYLKEMAESSEEKGVKGKTGHLTGYQSAVILS